MLMTSKHCGAEYGEEVWEEEMDDWGKRLLVACCGGDEYDVVRGGGEQSAVDEQMWL